MVTPDSAKSWEYQALNLPCVLHQVGTADGEVKVVSEVRLSQFLDTAPAFGGRR